MNDTVDSMYNIWALLCSAQGFLESKGCTFLSATSSSTISSLITNLAFSCQFQDDTVVCKKRGIEQCVTFVYHKCINKTLSTTTTLTKIVASG